MSFKVVVLGSGAAIPTLNRGTTSHFVNIHNRHILIDCGEGTQVQLRKFKVKYQKLDIILISHMHGDHVFGLVGLISTMQMMGRTQGLKIIGPPSLKEMIIDQMRYAGHKFEFDIEFIALNKGENGIVFEDKMIEISYFPLKHCITTFGYLIKEKAPKLKLDKLAFDKTGISVSYINKLLNGQDVVDSNGVFVPYESVTYKGPESKKYAFCSDTAYYPEIIPYIQGVDLLYHEATFLDKDKERAKSTYHSTAKQAAQIANDAKAKRLVMGHFSARYNCFEEHLKEAKSVFLSPVFVANDGDVFMV